MKNLAFFVIFEKSSTIFNCHLQQIIGGALWVILTYLAYRANGKKLWYIGQLFTAKVRDSWRHWKMTSFIVLDGVTTFLRLKDLTITCKYMRRSLNIGRRTSVQRRKVGRSCRLRMCFRCLLCVRIEIDQPQCVNCWVIIHCLSVSCTKINDSCCAIVIWSSLQLTFKQWIITQHITARADLFLKYNWYTPNSSSLSSIYLASISSSPCCNLRSLVL